MFYDRILNKFKEKENTMNNVEIFFKLLKRMEQLSFKKVGYMTRNTRIFIFKSNNGYNVYFGISNTLGCDFYEIEEDVCETAKSSELKFLKENYKKVFLFGARWYLTVSEQELNSILFVFNKKYSVTSGHFTSEIAKEKVVFFNTNSGSLPSASIIISIENAPQAINEHIIGTNETYIKLITMNDRDRKETVKMNANCSVQEYMKILDMLKERNPKNYLIEAYSLSYLEVMEYAVTLGNLPNQSNGENITHGFTSAEDFIRR